MKLLTREGLMSFVPTVLVLGGNGRIGSQIAQDILAHTNAHIIVTGRSQNHDHKSSLISSRIKYLSLHLDEQEKLRNQIKACTLVIHCAGPFHYRDGRVLKMCIEEGINYLDISDHRSFYQRVKPYHQQAKAAGITAILNTGVFPGISNSMARQGIETLDEAETVQLNYVVAGSGGAGLTVMRTTFLGIASPFSALINGAWTTVKPYTDREIINFPQPYGKTGVYWFDVAETYSLTESFPVKTVITKFASVPAIYNHLTWLTANWFPNAWLNNSQTIEFLSDASYKMTLISDRFSGIGIAIKVEVKGKKAGKSVTYSGEMSQENTAVAAGCGTGSIAQFMLEGKLKKPGIHPVEQVLLTDLFEIGMKHRGIRISQQLDTLQT